jgi:hypothetical protein
MLAMTLSGSISRKQQVRMVIEAVLQRATLFEHRAAASLQSIIETGVVGAARTPPRQSLRLRAAPTWPARACESS